MFSPRTARQFILLFIPLFAVMAFLYFWIIPVYEPVVLDAASWVQSKMDPPTAVGTDKWGRWKAFLTSGGYRRSLDVTWAVSVKHLHYLSIILLPSLVLATPIPWRKRFKLLAISLPLIFVAHVVAITGIVRMYYCLTIDPGDKLCMIGARICNTSGQLFGAALWALLTFRYWVGGRSGDA